MPCSSGYPSDLEIQVNDLRYEFEKITAMLCALCKKSKPETISSIKGLDKWWKEHRVIDAKRKKLEIERAKADLQEAEINVAKAKARLESKKTGRKIFAVGDEVTIKFSATKKLAEILRIKPMKGIYPNDFEFVCQHSGSKKQTRIRDARRLSLR